MEVLIVLLIVALVTVLSVVGLRSFAKTDLRNTASRMAGSIRYLFDRASTTGKVHRPTRPARKRRKRSPRKKR